MIYDIIARQLKLQELRFERISVGEETISFDDSPAVSLTPPQNANTAFVQVVNGGGAATATRVARFLESGTAPTATSGIILGDLGVYEVVGAECLKNFKIIAIDAATHKLNVIYYR